MAQMTLSLLYQQSLSSLFPQVGWTPYNILSPHRLFSTPVTSYQHILYIFLTHSYTDACFPDIVGFKEKVVTKEMLAKKAIKTQKRREQAQEKREEDKVSG